jgi:hypothetical protein
MLEKLHDHIVEELSVNTKTDIIFIITAIFLNFLALAINSAMAFSPEYFFIFILFILLILVVNTVVITGLSRGKQTRFKLLTGLMQMYKDEGIEKYYDGSILESYNTRYTLFTIAVVSTGILACLVPIVLYIIEN